MISILSQFFRQTGLSKLVTEYKFCPNRRWRFDYAIPEKKIGIEIEGGVWIRGRHSRGKGMIADMEKYNWAAIHGWKVLRYTPQNLTQAVNDVKEILKK